MRFVTQAALLSGLLLSSMLSSCSYWLFSTPNVQPDRTRPVCLLEFRGKPARLGATTAEGIVFLNEDRAKGICRVHYFLGPDLVIEDGTIGTFGGVYSLAKIDLKVQNVPVLMRDLLPEDELVAIVMNGDDVDRVDVTLAEDGIAEGYALAWPGRDLPAGTAIFRLQTGKFAGDLQFVGLATGLVTLSQTASVRRYITFTGPARMREAIAIPKPIFQPRRIKHRPDDISVTK